ncbi:MAG: TlpA family protein disulfide reductase [Bacteroidetes bacterium]|nr:TlpA family protein disulfide reductase [Bacteroidota bacterium]
MKKIIILASVLVVLVASAFQIGKKQLPDIKLKDVNGKDVNIKDYGKTGKITIISLWATWCKPCILEINNINEQLDTWKEKYKVQMVTVTVDQAKNTPNVKPFVDGQGWDFDVIMDTNQDLMHALNVPSVPYMLLIDQQGNIVYEHNGYNQGDEFILEKKLEKLAADNK